MEIDITVSSLLKAWGFDKYIDVFLENEVDVEALELLDDDQIKTLIPVIGPQAKFKKLLCKWKAAQQSAIVKDPSPLSTDFYQSSSVSSPVSVALPERQSILVLGPDGSLAGTPLDPEPSHVPAAQVTLLKDNLDNNTKEERSLEPKEFSFTLDELDIFKDIDTGINTVEEVGESPLRILLAKHTKGKLLLYKAKKGETLTSRDRGYIVSLIVEAELHSLQKINQTIRKDVWQKWSNEITLLFKGELKDLYYVPYHIVEGKVIQASGLIHNRLITHRRNLTPTKKRTSDSDSGCSSKSFGSSEVANKRLRPLPDEFEEVISNDNSEENVDWLRASSSPWNTLMTKWRATYLLRVKILKEISNKEYFDRFPGLRLPNGYELLTADFETVYPSANITFMERFPLVKLKLLKLLADHAESSRSDQTTIELLELASVGEEQANLAALLGIVTLLRQMHTITVPKKKLWRLSREETRSGFLARVASASEIVTYCIQREALNVSKGIPNQPFILAVGPSWANIHTYEIVITADGGVRYQVPTICAAVKVTYNLYWALDCAYPKVSAPCWMLIQRAIFQMKSKFDIEGVPLRELLSQLHSIN